MSKTAMISVIMPTLNNGETLAVALEALIPAAVQGLVREVIVVDGGSADRTRFIAEGAGAETLDVIGSTAQRLVAGAQKARFPWLLVLSPQSVLESAWEREVDQFIARRRSNPSRAKAAVFVLTFEPHTHGAQWGDRAMAFTGLVAGAAHIDQGLLIERAHYDGLGGFDIEAICPLVDLTRRLARPALVRLRSRTMIEAGPGTGISIPAHVAHYLSQVAKSVVRPLRRQRGAVSQGM
jgi:glycosyltransferase involved in cell wall biosynthesis